MLAKAYFLEKISGLITHKSLREAAAVRRKGAEVAKLLAKAKMDRALNLMEYASAPRLPKVSPAGSTGSSGHFWGGFDKRAVSLTGMMGGLRSGSKAFSSPGILSKPIGLKSGISVAPRAVPPSLPTPARINANQNMAARPAGQMPAMPNVPKPRKQSSRGVSSTSL